MAVQLPSTFKRRGIVYKPFSGLSGDWNQAKDVSLVSCCPTTRTQDCYYLVDTVCDELRKGSLGCEELWFPSGSKKVLSSGCFLFTHQLPLR